MSEKCFICGKVANPENYGVRKGLFSTTLHTECDGKIKRNKPKPIPIAKGLTKYLKDFESGKANPDNIKVKITMHDGFQILSPAKLTSAGKSPYAQKKEKSKT